MNLNRAMAQWLAREGVRTVFALMGDGNLQFVGEVEADGKVKVVHGRHENALLTMAHGYALMHGEVGVCTVTCGPGLAQVTTALTAATRVGAPVVLIAGETPLASPFHYQQYDAEGMIWSTGAHHVRIVTPERAESQFREAFFLARTRSVPVVVTIPVDVQQQRIDAGDYRPSTEFLLPAGRVVPDPESVAKVASVLQQAERPCVLAGRGAVAGRAGDAVAGLVSRLGAVAATTLPAQGLLDHLDPSMVVGIAGGFASPGAREILSSADCVLALGAGLGHYTTEAGRLFAGAEVIQVDSAPRALHEGRFVADHYLRSDARLGAEAIERVLRERGHAGQRWCLDARTEGEPVLGGAGESPYRTSPAAFVSALRSGIPREARVVVGGGHFWSFVLPDFRVVAPENLFITADFGAIAQALPFSIGGSVDADRPHFVIEGDGGLLMHLQELETAVRYRVPCCYVILNDGGYSAEKHMLAAHGHDGSIAEFGYVDVAGVAAALGAGSRTVTEAEELHEAVSNYRRDDGPLVIDVRYSADWVSAPYQRMFFTGEGH